MLATERVHLVAHGELLSPEQRKLYGLTPADDAAAFLIAKLAAHRAAAGPVAALQAKVRRRPPPPLGGARGGVGCGRQKWREIGGQK